MASGRQAGRRCSEPAGAGGCLAGPACPGTSQPTSQRAAAPPLMGTLPAGHTPCWSPQNNAQLDGAFEYLKRVGGTALQPAELDEASGVGVVVTQQQAGRPSPSHHAWWCWEAACGRRQRPGQQVACSSRQSHACRPGGGKVRTPARTQAASSGAGSSSPACHALRASALHGSADRGSGAGCAGQRGATAARGKVVCPPVATPASSRAHLAPAAAYAPTGSAAASSQQAAARHQCRPGPSGRRYHFNTNTLMPGISKALKWADGAAVRAELVKQVGRQQRPGAHHAAPGHGMAVRLYHASGCRHFQGYTMHQATGAVSLYHASGCMHFHSLPGSAARCSALLLRQQAAAAQLPLRSPGGMRPQQCTCPLPCPQVEALLGPKTEADLAPREKPKKPKVGQAPGSCTPTAGPHAQGFWAGAWAGEEAWVGGGVAAALSPPCTSAALAQPWPSLCPVLACLLPGEKGEGDQAGGGGQGGGRGGEGPVRRARVRAGGGGQPGGGGRGGGRGGEGSAWALRGA